MLFIFVYTFLISIAPSSSTQKIYYYSHEIVNCIDATTQSYVVNNKKDDGYRLMLQAFPLYSSLFKPFKKRFPPSPYQAQFIRGGGIATSTYSLSYIPPKNTLILAFRGVNFFDPHSVSATLHLNWVRPHWLHSPLNKDIFIFEGLNCLLLDLLDDDENILNILSETIETYRPSLLLLTGHSQGASLMQYFSVFLEQHFRESHISTPIGLITFASPRTGNRAFHNYFSSLPFDPCFDFSIFLDPVSFFPVPKNKLSYYVPSFIRSPLNRTVSSLFSTTKEHMPVHSVPPTLIIPSTQPPSFIFYQNYVFSTEIQQSIRNQIHSQPFPQLLTEKHLHYNIANLLRRALFSQTNYQLVPSSIFRKHIKLFSLLTTLFYKWLSHWNQRYWFTHKDRTFFFYLLSINLLLRFSTIYSYSQLSHQSFFSPSSLASTLTIDLTSLSFISLGFQQICHCASFLPSSPWTRTGTFALLLLGTQTTSIQTFFFHILFSIIYGTNKDWIEKTLNLWNYSLNFIFIAFSFLYHTDQLIFFLEDFPLPLPTITTSTLVFFWFFLYFYSTILKSSDGDCDQLFNMEEALFEYNHDEILDTDPTLTDPLFDEPSNINSPLSPPLPISPPPSTSCPHSPTIAPSTLPLDSVLGNLQLGVQLFISPQTYFSNFCHQCA